MPQRKDLFGAHQSGQPRYERRAKTPASVLASQDGATDSGDFFRDAAAGRSRLLRVTQPCFSRRVLRSAAGRFPRLRAEPPNDCTVERFAEWLAVQGGMMR